MEPAMEPAEYLSIRITIPHKDIPKVIEHVLFDAEWYFLYPHFGKNGDNEHVHIALPWTTEQHRDTLRKRIANSVGAVDRKLGTKHFKNGVSKAIQYMSRENTEPVTRGDAVSQWIADAPAWVPGQFGGKIAARKRRRIAEDSEGEFDLNTIINMYNVVGQAVRFYKRNKFEHLNFRKTLLAMIQSNKYTWHFTHPLDDIFKYDFRAQLGDVSGAQSLLDCICGPEPDFTPLPNTTFVDT